MTVRGQVFHCALDAPTRALIFAKPGGRLLRFFRTIWLTCAVLALSWNASAQDQEVGFDRTRAYDVHYAYQARVDSLIDYFANRISPADLSQGGYFDIAAKLHRRQDLDWVLARLDTLMQDPRGDMFWMFPVTTVIFEGRGVLPHAYQDRLRDLWRTYMPFRGDTENHWLLYYATLYLMSEAYPNQPPESWYTGKSSEENLAESREWLLHWIDLTTTIGQGEYDSPHYITVFIAPLALLHAFAEDPAMRQRAGMMLDYVIADYAAESLHGMYGGAHSRVYEREAVQPWLRPSVRFGWLLFGANPFAPGGDSYILAISPYEPPPILHHIATDRSKPYVHRELKRTRHRIRNSDVRNAPVYKYTMMRPEYTLGSSQGGLLQPIQQQTWHLSWIPDDLVSARNTLFTVQPYSSPLEGTMYFAEHWQLVTELIVRSKTEYDSPDKWTGGSPYEQVFQHEDALIALYDIPEGTRFPHVSGFFSRDLVDREVDESGWIFARGGDALIAYYPLAPYAWREEEGGDFRLHSPHLKNGAVVQVAPAGDYESHDAFKAAMRSRRVEVSQDPVPTAVYETLGGDVLEARFGATPTVNGVPLRYDEWPLFDGPFLKAERGSRRLEMRYGHMRREHDLNTLSTREWVELSDEPDDVSSARD